MRRAAALLVLLASLVLAPTASGHATLTGTSPERGAVVPDAPRSVSFRFSEPVEAAFGAVKVFDARAERVDDGRVTRPAAGDRGVAVGLHAGLPDGTYTATYRVVSADGHPVSGGLVFSVGAAGAGPARSVDELLGATSSGPVTARAFDAARGFGFAAIALTLGVLVFLVAVWRPVGTGSAAVTRRTTRVLGGAVALGVLSALASLWLYAATAAGTGAWDALDGTVLRDALETRTGRAYGLRALVFAGLAVVLAAVWWRARGADAGCGGDAARGEDAGRAPLAQPVLAVLAALVLALATLPALGGHAGVTSPKALLIAADAVHVLAMAAWVGGLVAILVLVAAATRRLDPPDRSRLLATTLDRFSPIALTAVLALAATGTFAAVVQLDRLGDLTATGYGQAILVKAGLLVALVAAGAVNRRRTLPALRRAAAATEPPGAAGRTLRRTLRAEVLLLVAVLGTTGVLTGLSPDASATGPFSARTGLGPITLEATVDPARTGANEMHLYLYDRQGAPFTATKEITATFALPDEDIPPIATTLRAAGPGHYVADTVALAPAGTWELVVEDRVSDFDAYTTTVEVEVR